MAGRPSQRKNLVESALAEFSTSGFAAASVAGLTERAGVSKAAFVYHFDSKDALLVELVEPLLDDLDEMIERHGPDLVSPDAIEAFLREYLQILLAHAEIAEWVDGDKSVLHHPVLGPRLEELNRRAHKLLVGDGTASARRGQASAVLGMLWRPVRNLPALDVEDYQVGIVELATDAVAGIRNQT